MKLSHPFFAAPFDFEKAPVHTLIIENPALFRTLMGELLSQCDGLKGEFLLTASDGAADIGKAVECVTDLFRLEPSENKRLCAAVQKELAELARYELSAELLSLYSHLHELLTETIHRSGLDVEYDDVSDISGIFKLYNLRPSLPNASFGEKLLLYMELCAKYLKKKLFVLFHLHALLSAEEMAAFCKNAFYQKLPLLLVEGKGTDCSALEYKHVIDPDMCEI